MSFYRDFYRRHKGVIGSFLAFFAAVAVTGAIVVLCVRAEDEEGRQKSRQAHSIVYEACGSDAARRFERVYADYSGWDRQDEAEKWASQCAERP